MSRLDDIAARLEAVKGKWGVEVLARRSGLVRIIHTQKEPNGAGSPAAGAFFMDCRDDIRDLLAFARAVEALVDARPESISPAVSRLALRDLLREHLGGE